MLRRRHSTSTSAELEPLTMRMPTMAVWGANTGVGKTLFSAGLGAACERAKVSVCRAASSGQWRPSGSAGEPRWSTVHALCE